MYAFDVRDRPLGANASDGHEGEAEQEPHPSEFELLVRLCTHGHALPVWQSARRSPQARRPAQP